MHGNRPMMQQSAFVWGLVDGHVVRGTRVEPAERGRKLATRAAHSLLLPEGDGGGDDDDDYNNNDSSGPADVISSAAGLDHAVRVVVCQQNKSAAGSGGGNAASPAAAIGVVEARGGNTYGQADPSEAAAAARLATWTRMAGLPAAASFVEAAAGERHSMARTGDGRVFVWGERWREDGSGGAERRSDGAEGNGSSTSSSSSSGLREVDFGAPPPGLVVGIAAGGRHCLALTQSGDVFAWGSNLQGECGLDPKVASFLVPKPAHVGPLGGVPIALVAAGSAHCVAVSRDGAAYAWGRGLDGELGCGLTDRGGSGSGEGDEAGGNGNGNGAPAAAWRAAGLGVSRSDPCLVEGGGLAREHVVQAACGARHTLLRCASGAVYGFGFNAYGQCCCCCGGGGGAGDAPAATVGAPLLAAEAGISRSWACAHGDAIYSPVRAPLAEAALRRGAVDGGDGGGTKRARSAGLDDRIVPIIKAVDVRASGWRSVVIVASL